MRLLLVTVSAATSLFAQMMPPGPPGTPTPGPVLGPSIVQFLELTDEQVRLIRQQNAEFNRFVAEKNRRAAQVRSEIVEETRKAVLDPMALGVRYMELELIRREIGAAEEKLRSELRNALTAAQLERLRALEQAMQLVPLYGQAAAIRLVPPQPTTPPGTPVRPMRAPDEAGFVEDPIR